MSDADTPRNQHGYLRELTERECLELIPTATAGHVAFIGATGQQLLPINFRFMDGIVYFQTSPDSVLAEMARGLDDVAFSVDYREDLLQTGWSVVIAGNSSVVEDPDLAELVRGPARFRPWAPGERSLVIALTPRSISGRRVSQH